LSGLLLSLLLISGCGGDDSHADSYEVTQTRRDGPLTATLQVSSSKFTIDKRLRVRLEVVAPASAQVTLPEVGSAVGQMDIIASDPEPDEAVEGGLTRRAAVFVIEAYLPGKYAIGPLKVSCAGAGGAQESFSIETEKVDIEVASLLAAGDGQGELMDIAPLAEIRGPLWPVNRTIALAIVGLSLACWAALAIKRRRTLAQGPVAKPIGPDEIARAELDRLMGEKLIQSGRENEFYTRLSRIVRRYVESRFDLRPLVQTTQQFLAELLRATDFDAGHKVILREFLGQCDMVKFAGRKPTAEAADAAVGTCRRFIDESSPTPQPQEAIA